MTRVVVLRPEPGNADTCAKLRGLGLEPLAMPVFTVVPVAWTPPDFGGFDAVLLTSANAVRHGALPDTLKALPVIAVGDATAAAARRAGFNVAVTGTSNVDAAIDAARASGFDRLFHPAGRDRRPTGPDVVACTVYASEALRIGDIMLPRHEDLLVLIHSPRAAHAFAEHVAQAGIDRSRVTIAAISQAAADAAGSGWAALVVAETPTDDALVTIAAKRAIDPDARRGDKRVMSDHVPIERPRARGPRLGVIIIVIGLAFIAGSVAMGYALKTMPWFGQRTGLTASGSTTAAAASGNPDFTPAQPLNANGEQPRVDTAMLATREATLAGQLTALEARTAAVSSDAMAAGGQATRAEGLMVAFAARRAIDRGVGLGYIEEQLRLRFGRAQPRATAAVIQASHQPVTIEDLRQGLDTIAPQITSTNGTTNDSWLQTVRREFSNLIVLREESMASPMPADRLARARRLLEAGQVEAARAEVERLPGATQASNWMDAARRYIVARKALDILENTALMGQAGQPQPTPIVVTTPVLPPVATSTQSEAPVAVPAP
jgi:uroporphyrinogen-III synthase